MRKKVNKDLLLKYLQQHNDKPLADIADMIIENEKEYKSYNRDTIRLHLSRFRTSNPLLQKDIALSERLKHVIKSKKTFEQICDILKVTPKEVRQGIKKLEEQHIVVDMIGDHLQLGVEMKPDEKPIKINTGKYAEIEYPIGFTSDNHLGSKYERLDVLNDLYDRFVKAGVETVYNGGNIIDGECRFNKYDIYKHGVNAQVKNFVEKYPERKGIVTKFVTGDDHEGWYVQREHINIGKYIEVEAEQAGRSDLVHLGYMERDIEYKQKGGSAIIRVIHAGGGSTYATSYTSQKYVECVPLDSEILTKNGWKKYNEIAVGDTVMGYNLETKQCEWTELKAINVFGEQLVETYKNDNFIVTCTPNHKWAVENEMRGSVYKEKKYEYSPIEQLTTIGDVTGRGRIIQAAKGPDGEGFKCNTHHSILDRINTVQAVLEMTSDQRVAFIYGMMAGEGCVNIGKKGRTQEQSSLSFAQNPGSVHEAFVLACFLEGKAVSTKNSGKIWNDKFRTILRTTILKNPKRMVTSMKKIKEHKTEVWCPTTGLGTWVMRQNDVITITGNSLQGGEKPAIVLVGHFHKFDYSYPRNVHIIQMGTTMDQTPFMRKKRIEAHLGGGIIWVKQNTKGIFTSVKIEWMPYYDKKFYQYHW